MAKLVKNIYIVHSQGNNSCAWHKEEVPRLGVLKRKKTNKQTNDKRNNHIWTTSNKINHPVYSHTIKIHPHPECLGTYKIVQSPNGYTNPDTGP